MIILYHLLRDGTPGGIVCEGSRITRLLDADAAHKEAEAAIAAGMPVYSYTDAHRARATGVGVIDCGGQTLRPGLIDIHSHGCIGLDTMDLGALSEMAAYEFAHGITTWFPTTMTASAEEIEQVTAQPLPQDTAHLPGFHLEGPFINATYKGAQRAVYIVPPTVETFRRFGNIARTTLAPEVPGALDFIRACGIQVSIGHTACTYDDLRRAAEAGATSLTHTFNAMSPIHHRNPGPIPAAWETGLFAEVIADGRHLHPAIVRMAHALFGTQRMVLISDSMRATGLGDGVYQFGGQQVTVENGRALTASGNLAGSTSTLYDCVLSAIGMGIAADDAFAMASDSPARLMHLNKGQIREGYDADFILTDREHRLLTAMIF